MIEFEYRGVIHRTPYADKFTELRPHQAEAITKILDAFHDGYEVVMLDAPVGSGKTLIAVMVAEILNQRMTYVCNSKSLQDQFMVDFGEAGARMLKGRANYPTLHNPQATAEDCNIKDGVCAWCSPVHRCPYKVARLDAVQSTIAVLNTAYWLAESNKAKGSFVRDLTVIDEADTLEGEVLRFIEWRLSRNMASQLGVTVPKKGTHKTTIQGWIEAELKPALKRGMARRGEDLATNKFRRRCTRMYMDLAGMDIREDNWIRDAKQDGLVFRPVRAPHGQASPIWRHTRRVLAMSGTFVSPEQWIEDTGCDKPWTVVSVPMTFPVENRPTIYAPVADMSRKGGDEAVDMVMNAIGHVVEDHVEGLDENLVIHSVSYDLTKRISERLRSEGFPVITYSTGSQRQTAINQFIERGGILVGPSLDRGIDLPDDLCRVQVIAKVPYPYLGDPQIGARLNQPGGDSWYKVQTARSLMQMTGRAVRHEGDSAVTYIFDKQFSRFLSKGGKKLLTSWWEDAVECVSARRFL